MRPINVLLVTVAATIGAVTSCTLDGVNNWWVDLNVIDTDRGVFYTTTTTAIQGIQSSSHSGDGLNAGPYFEASFADSTFSLALSDEFARYEENETAMTMSISVTFSCTNGNTADYVFITTITDTNNNSPVFVPSDVITVGVTPPLAPGFSLTGCENDDLLVRDIDLTTQRIDFNIEDNDYFEIAYDAAASGGKSFAAVLRTKAFIRSLTEPISLWISATDVDLTGDPQRTTMATLVVDPDTSYQLPDEPRFSRAYYTLAYSAGNLSQGDIELVQGYDDMVSFNLTGEYSEYFTVTPAGSSVQLSTASALPAAAAPGPLLLVLAAARQDTSGALATVIVEFPDFTEIRFTQPHYEGQVVDNELNVSQLTLEQGYENGFTVNILNEYSQYFSHTIQDNMIMLSMLPLDDDVIEANSVLVLQVVAANEATSTVAVVTLEIVKEDITTPGFTQNIYRGTYGEDGLELDDIILTQGYDDTVTFNLEGEHNELFTLSQVGNVITLGVNSTLPPEVLESEQFILLALTASKPGAPSANTAVSISLPTARQLSFERASYRGETDGRGLSLAPMTLSAGYADDVYFTLNGDLESYFNLTNDGNEVSIELSTSLPDEVLSENNNILLTVVASGINAISASTVVLIDLLKNDTETPVFTQEIYYAYYDNNQTTFENDIMLLQGYDDTVNFILAGESSRYFLLSNNNSSVTLTLQNAIPEDVILEEKFLVFTVLARKPFTADANTAIVVTFPRELTESTVMRFTKSAYTGSLRDDVLNVEDIVLGTGFATGTEFTLDLSSYFTLSIDENVVSISLLNTIPTEALQNDLIILEITANRTRSISAASSVVIQVENDSTIPVFSAAYYRGTYSIDNGLQFNDTIYLLEGFDDLVTFALAGDDSQYFTLDVTENEVTINLTTSIPQEVALNNRLLLFSIVASNLQVQATAAVSIDLLDFTTNVMSFSEIYYTGVVNDGVLDIVDIHLAQGYSDDVIFDITGDLSEYFEVTNDGDLVSLQMRPEMPLETLVDTDVLVLTLEARAETSSALAVIVLNVVNNATTENRILVFEEAYYVGEYSEADGLYFTHQMQLVEGHDDAVQYYLDGENSELFSLVQTGTSFSLTLSGDIPAETLNNNRNFVFAIAASDPEGHTAFATIVIAVDYQINNETIVLQFESRSYEGNIENGVLELRSISLIEGYSENVTFILEGDLSNYFGLTHDDNNINIDIETAIPANTIPDNGIIILEVQAVAPYAVSAYATLIIHVESNDINIVFDRIYYSGSYTQEEGLIFTDTITLSEGYTDDVIFSLDGENVDWFTIDQNDNAVSLVTSVDLASATDEGHLLFTIAASRPGARVASAAVFVSIERDTPIESDDVSFESGLYSGTVRDGVVEHEVINLVGYNGGEILLYGPYAEMFSAVYAEGTVSVSAAASAALPEDSTFVALELAAGDARTALVLTVEDTDAPNELDNASFESGLYSGSVRNGVVEHEVINLVGYNGNDILIYGPYAEMFSAVHAEGTVSVLAAASVALPEYSTFVALELAAGEARTALVLTVEDTDVPIESDNASFENGLYSGSVRNGVVEHEVINLVGYNGNDILIYGSYAAMFSAVYAEGTVSVSAAASAALPEYSTFVALELAAGDARTALVLTVEDTESPPPPSVSFSSSAYEMRAEAAQTGVLGRVHAAADNGEDVEYSLLMDSEHLQQRLSVLADGSVVLSAPADPGAYSVTAVGTAAVSRAFATAEVHLRVEAITTCDIDDIVVPPLIVLDRDEESAHRDLVTLGSHSGCSYSLANRWPADQQWLYVDDAGLHTTAIDREDDSIAFMVVSQVQVELTLQCVNDTAARTKRSADYGGSEWVLAESIPFDSRRTLVTLVVNDINDNYPVFEGRAGEPLAVGWPVDALLGVVRPRALAELHATDRDIGANAALRYWSAAAELAVAPTGLVHVRDNARVPDGLRATVHATDRDGAGLTGDIDLVVRLVGAEHIAVITVRNSFLEDEASVLELLTTELGYEVKALTSSMISDEYSEATRRKRQATGGSASLQLYVYGLRETEPVNVNDLLSDLGANTISAVLIAESITLGDYLERLEIVIVESERDTGLFVATIVLSILLLMLIIAIALWIFLKRKGNQYDEFSDENSLASRNDSVNVAAKPVVPTPRVNIDELKRSERRLQELLNAPIEEITVEPKTKATSEPVIVPTTSAPIVIQSIDKLKGPADTDDEDEFGEVKLTERRKSVVTFNENVEKIIHIDDGIDEDSNSDVMVERF